jgi:hypothetical protein
MIPLHRRSAQASSGGPASHRPRRRWCASMPTSGRHPYDVSGPHLRPFPADPHGQGPAGHRAVSRCDGLSTVVGARTGDSLLTKARAGWHRSPRCINRRQAKKRLRIGEPWRSRNVTCHHARRWLGARDYPGRAKREAPPPLLADLDCAVRGPGPVTPRLPGALSYCQSIPPPGRTPPAKVPRARALWPTALAGRWAGCGRQDRRLACTRATDGQLWRARPPRQQILLTASTCGVAAALHTQPLELSWFRESIRTRLSDGAYPQLVLRFGTVTQTAASVRRTPDDVLTASGGEHRSTSHE